MQPDRLVLPALFLRFRITPELAQRLCAIQMSKIGFRRASLHEVGRVVFSCRLPEDRRRSILGQRGVRTSAHPR
jgi:hypothetical protein